MWDNKPRFPWKCGNDAIFPSLSCTYSCPFLNHHQSNSENGFTKTVAYISQGTHQITITFIRNIFHDASLNTVAVKITIFCNVIVRSRVNVYERLKGTCCTDENVQKIRKCQRTLTKYYFGDRWQVRLLRWNTPANLKGELQYAADLRTVQLLISWMFSPTLLTRLIWFLVISYFWE